MVNLGEVVCFVPSRNPRKTRSFYENVLGLRFVGQDQFAAVFDMNGITLRLVNVKGVRGFKPAPFTIIGWRVKGIRGTIQRLRKKGVKFERYAGMEQDDIGVWTSPEGAKVAWFKDPDGNVLSVSEY